MPSCAARTARSIATDPRAPYRLLRRPRSTRRPRPRSSRLAEAGALANDMTAPIDPARAPADHRPHRCRLGELTIWRDAGPILARLDAVRFQVVLVTLSAAAVAAVLLFVIFRSAQKRLTRQTVELVESTRRDPLTGTYNHGALVSLLAARIGGVQGDRRAHRRGPHRHRQLHAAQRQPGARAGDTALMTVLDVLDLVCPGMPSSAGTAPTSSS